MPFKAVDPAAKKEYLNQEVNHRAGQDGVEREGGIHAEAGDGGDDNEEEEEQRPHGLPLKKQWRGAVGHTPPPVSPDFS